MSNEALGITQLLQVFLIISIIILFILVVVFVAITIKNKKEKNKNSDKEENRKNSPMDKSKEKKKENIIQPQLYTAENVEKFMDFDEIKDNMIIQKAGKKVIMVVRCQGVNYDLMSSIEKIAVEEGFVQFLNTLTKPIQLYIQSRKVNLEESIVNYKKRLKSAESSFNKIKIQYEQASRNPDIQEEVFKKIKLEYIRQKNLIEYTKDIISNTEKMSLNKNILTKNYYFAISYYPENTENLFQKEELIDMAFSELYTEAQSLLRTLSICGITGKVLDSTELADLLYVAYNRDSSEIYGVDKAIKSGYDSLYINAPDVVQRKIEELDKMINEKAFNLANQTIDKVILKNKRQKELELREKQIDDIIQNMAKNIIKENKEYISEEIAEESIKEIDNIKKTKSVETSKKKVKKGA